MKDKRNKRYTKEEVRYVVDHYRIRSDEEIAKVLGRSAVAIACMRKRRGLDKVPGAYGGEYALYKGDELLGIGTMREIAQQLGLHISTVYRYKNHEGYEFIRM